MSSLRSFLLGATAVALLASFTACSSAEPAAPSRPPTPAPATPSADGGSGDGGPSAADCFDTSKSEPVEPQHFLNQCNGTECFAFDNGARIEGFAPGAPLPPLN